MPDLDRTAAPRADAGATSPPNDFVGREEELLALVGARRAASTGRGGLYLLAGEPGIGKTRLAAEFAVRSQREGARVCWGRCWEAGGAPAYWPWIQSLRGLVEGRPPEVLAAVVAGDGPELAKLLPELDPHPSTGAASLSADADVARFRLFAALDRFLGRASEVEPIVLILEDLHAADPPSMLLLRFLTGGMVARDLLIVGTYRDVDLTREHPLTEIIAELARGPGATRVSLAGLRLQDAAKLIETVTGEPPTEAVVEALHRGTNGNPLFLGEVARLLAAEGSLRTRGAAQRMLVPESLRGAIGRRLEGLPDPCREILAIASVFGHDFVVDTVARVDDRGVESIGDCLRRAVTNALLVPVPSTAGRFRFAHALVRDSLYEDLAPAERFGLHRAVGDALEGLYAVDPGPHVAELAYHFLEAGPAGDLDKAIDYAVRAGRRAVDLLAYEEAVRLFRMAHDGLRESPDDQLRCEVLLRLGDAQARAGSTAESKATLRDAAEIAIRLDDPERLGRIALGYAGRVPWLRAGTDRYVIPLLRQALDAVGEHDSVLRVLLLSRLAGALRDQPSVAPRAALAEQAVAMARRLGDAETLIYALLAQWAATLLGPDSVDDALRVAQELNAIAERVQDRERLVDAGIARYVALMTRGDVWEARELVEAVTRTSDELRQPSQRFYAAILNQALRLQDGRFEEAERFVDDLPGSQAQPWDAGITRLLASFILQRERGQLAKLEKELRQAPTEYPGYRSIRCMLVVALCDLGRHDEARALFERLAVDEFAGFPRDSEWLYALTLLAEAAHALEDRARAAMLYDLLQPYAGLVGLAASEVSTGPVGRPLGLLATVLGRQDVAAAHFEDALERCRRMGARPWAAHTQYAYATMLMRIGRPTDRRRAIELLRSARATAAETGMTVLARNTEDRLNELGAGPPQPGRSGEHHPAGPAEQVLTPREREVAELVAQGSSNRQIAERLHVSERTVETHVQNIFIRLGFHSRTQIATWLSTGGQARS